MYSYKGEEASTHVHCPRCNGQGSAQSKRDESLIPDHLKYEYAAKLPLYEIRSSAKCVVGLLASHFTRIDISKQLRASQLFLIVCIVR